jgi:hypothetical protein
MKNAKEDAKITNEDVIMGREKKTPYKDESGLIKTFKGFKRKDLPCKKKVGPSERIPINGEMAFLVHEMTRYKA